MGVRGEERPIMIDLKRYRESIRFLIGRGGAAYMVQGKSHINGLMNE